MDLLKDFLLFSARTAFAVAITTALVAPVVASAQGEANITPELQRELRYIQGLQNRGYVDIADAVIKDISVRYPEAKARLAQLSLQSELMQGKFDEIKKRISARPDKGSTETWAMKLTLADAYYAWGKYPECKAIYSEFVKPYVGGAPVPKELTSIFVDSVYKYGQMLRNLKEDKEAFAAYKILLAQKGKDGKSLLPHHVERQCLAEMGELAVSLAEDASDASRASYIKEATDIADKLLWETDLWFGKAIVLKAHCKMLEKKPAEAQKLVNEYMDTLSMIHQSLVEQEQETGERLTRVSPISECRYLLAEMLYKEATKLLKAKDFSASNPQKREEVLALLLGPRINGSVNSKRDGTGAYNHYLNVYAKFPESSWAADAGEKAEELRNIFLDTFGSEVKSQISEEQNSRIREILFKDARLLFAQNQIENAKERLLQAITKFPAAPEAVSAITDLCRCYMPDAKIGSEAELMVDILVGHLAERFSTAKESILPAGNAVITIAEEWKTKNRADKYAECYDYFFKNFAEHPSCASYLNKFGREAMDAGNYDEALKYYQITAENYAKSPRALDAYASIVSIYEKQKDDEKLIPAAENYLKCLEAEPKPTIRLAQAKYRLANAHRNVAMNVLRSKDEISEDDTKKGTQELATAVKLFNELADYLKSLPPSLTTDAKDKEQCASLRAAALMSGANCLMQFPQPDEAKKAALRDKAAERFANVVENYPKSDSAPIALMQLGTIYTMKKDVAGAEKALNQLRKDYPDSDQAKNALPMLARSLMELGMREEAISRYRDMFTSAGGRYTNSDLLFAAQALKEAREFSLAREGIDAILKGVTDAEGAVKTKARFLNCDLLVQSKDYVTAVSELQSFIKDYPNFNLMIDAKVLLATAASEAGKVEKDSDKRFDYFNAAIAAQKDVSKRRTDKLDKAKADIEVGRIMVRKADAEKQFGDKEKAQGYIGQALLSYQNFIDTVDTTVSGIMPVLEAAYCEVTPLLADNGQWEYVKENCEGYFAKFPNGAHKTDFLSFQNQANNELSK